MKCSNINSFFIFLASIAVLPITVFAHVKWFVESDVISPVKAYSFYDTPVFIWVIVSAFIIAVGMFLEEKLSYTNGLFRSVLNFFEPVVVPLFRILVGLGLVFFSMKGYIFAPIYTVTSSSLGILLSIFQMTLGAALVFGVFTQILGVLLFILYFMFGFRFGFLAMLETLEFLGVAFVFLFGVPTYFSIFRSRAIELICQKYNEYSVPVLRVLTGINLIILGFTEKILHPALGVAFLQEHQFNFMQALGFSQYSDYWFVLSAGVVEILFGIIFVLGIVTRLNAVVISSFFIATLMLLGPSELAGHIPHFAIMILLIVFGSGKKLKVINK